MSHFRLPKALMLVFDLMEHRQADPEFGRAAFWGCIVSVATSKLYIGSGGKCSVA